MPRKSANTSEWMVHQLRLLPFGGSEQIESKPKKSRRSSRGGCDAACGSMQDELAKFIRHWAEVPSPVLVPDEVARLSGAAFEELKRLGLLLPGGTARAVGCAACDLDHAEWVETVADRDGEPRFFIDCPKEGRVEVSRQRLQQWTVDFTPLARAIKESLRAFGPVEAVHPGRLWRLGKAVLAGRPRALWMAREVASVPGPELGRSIPRAGEPVIFLLGWPPSKSILGLGSEALFDLRRVVHIRGAGFHVNRHAVERRLRSQKAAEEAAETQLLCCCG